MTTGDVEVVILGLEVLNSVCMCGRGNEGADREAAVELKVVTLVGLPAIIIELFAGVVLVVVKRRREVASVDITVDSTPVLDNTEGASFAVVIFLDCVAGVDIASSTVRCGVPMTEAGTELVDPLMLLMPLAVLDADEETACGALVMAGV